MYVLTQQQPMHSIINVYPNPASDKFYVEYAFPGEKINRVIRILTINGNLLETHTLKQQAGIFVYNKKLPSGTYIIKVGENYTEKIVIQ
jgi:hypothetical protein